MNSIWDQQTGCEFFTEESRKEVTGLLCDVKSVLQPSINAACYHTSQGLKACVRDTWGSFTKTSYVYKTDISSYYASIDHGVVLNDLHGLGMPKDLIRRVAQYLTRLIWTPKGAQEATRGLPKGGALSPLLGGLYLQTLDERLSKLAARFNGFYARYMDDIVVIAPTRHKLRRMRRVLYEELNTKRLSLRPEKTHVGRGDKAFEFLGYRFDKGNDLIHVGDQTTQRAKDKARRRSAQGDPPQQKGSLAAYLKRFEAWVKGGLKDLPVAPIEDIKNEILRESNTRPPQFQARP